MLCALEIIDKVHNGQDDSMKGTGCIYLEEEEILKESSIL